MDNTKFQIAALMFERRGIIYILIVASLESVRWQLQQERRSNEVIGVRQCLTELEWNLQQVRAMWQGVWANDTQHRSMNTSEQCRCHNEFSQRWKKKKNDLLKERCRTALTDIRSQGIILETNGPMNVIIWTIFFADHN